MAEHSGSGASLLPEPPRPEPLRTEVKSHRVLLTGATGFIGRHVERQLLDAGHQVLAIVRPERTSIPLDPRTSVIRASLLDPVGIGTALAQATAVIHLAGAVRGATAGEFSAVNVDGVRVMRDAILDTNPDLPVLLMSSLAASFPELSEYSASKRAGEDLLTADVRLRWTVIRPPAVYGPGDKELRLLLNLLRRGVIIIPGNPEQRLSFIHVTDLAAACVHWLTHHQILAHRVFSIDDGRADGYDWPAIESEVCERHLLKVVIPPGLLRVLGRVNGWVADRLDQAPMFSPGKVRELMNPSWIARDTEGTQAFAAATGWHPAWQLGHGVRQTFESTSLMPHERR